MSNVDPLVWISLFVIAMSGAGLVVAEVSSRRLDRKHGRRES